jgi:hypothetical protein
MPAACTVVGDVAVAPAHLGARAQPCLAPAARVIRLTIRTRSPGVRSVRLDRMTDQFT